MHAGDHGANGKEAAAEQTGCGPVWQEGLHKGTGWKHKPQSRLMAASAKLLTKLLDQHANNVPACVSQRIISAGKKTWSWHHIDYGLGEQVTKFITGEMKTPSKKAAKDKAAKLGKVLIVGAGPAGLAAAKHLQVLLSSPCIGAYATQLETCFHYALQQDLE
jgi:hypothetical protein